MMIRQAETGDFEILKEHDRHISEQELKNSIFLKRIYIAEENGGFTGWLRYNLFWDNTPFMNMLFLTDGNRGKGLGKKLTQYWEARMKTLGYDTVMTSTASDEYAQHFYYRLGYAAIGGFQPGDDPYEILLAKKI